MKGILDLNAARARPHAASLPQAAVAARYGHIGELATRWDIVPGYSPELQSVPKR